MRVPIEWLADYVDYRLSTEELGHRLTMSGLKVEAIERRGVGWEDVLIGQVVELAPHPTSNKPLHVARVEVGDRQVTVVTGAQNVHLHDRAPIVLIGGTIPHGPDGLPMTIVARPMAGITSEGMLCSARELGISEEHAGIYILPAEAPVGERLANYLGGDVLDLETVSNRPDTLSIIGVAREVAALTGQGITPPDVERISDRVQWVDEDSVVIRVEDEKGCPRYSALRVDGVSVVPSPAWLTSRLEASGQRPINLLVDLTNYIMLEMGQPMHAFDARALRSGWIGVRRSRPNESIRTLDGQDRALPLEALVITDGDQPTAVAGVMGGEESEIGAGTTSLILEAANFEAPSVRRTAQTMGLRTEASSRFEKGLPLEGTVPALLRYVQLLDQILECPLQVARVSDALAHIPAPTVVTMPMRDVRRLLGIDVSVDRAAEVLSLLGFGITVREDAIDALVPPWRRVDILQSADLVEEVGRLVGFDALPTTLPRRTMPPTVPEGPRRWEGVVRDRLLAGGASEITTHSLTSPAAMRRMFRSDRSRDVGGDTNEWADLIPNPVGVWERGAQVAPVTLLNPATTDRQLLRLMLLPSVLDVLARNLKVTDERLSFFEMDRTIFQREGELPYERRTVATALSGTRWPRSWNRPDPGPCTFYDVKGMVAAMLESLRVTAWSVEHAPHPSLHPGRSAVLNVGGHPAGFLGELHPDVAAAFDISGWPVQVAEIDLDTLYAAADDNPVYEPLPRYPAVYRDLAAVVAADLPADRFLGVIETEAGELLESARIFDVYQGERLGNNAKSIAVGLTFRSRGGTLTQENINPVMDCIVNALSAQLGAQLRK